MIVYLEKKAIFAKNEDNLVYRLKSMEMYDGYDSLRLNLVLVCGFDYINPDISDEQGWCPANKFIEDVQDTQEICYIMSESIKECLEVNGYEILEECPIKLQDN